MTSTRKPAVKKTAPADPDRHELPSGGWVRLRNVDHLRARDVKTVTQDVQRRVNATEADRVEVMAAITDAFIALMIAEWELPYEAADGKQWVRPSEDDSLIDDIRADDYNFLAELLTPVVMRVLPPAMGGARAMVDPRTPASG